MPCRSPVEVCSRCERKGWDWCATCNASVPAQPSPAPSGLTVHAMPTFETQMPGGLDISLQTFRELQALQTREIEPEDYDLLLLLSAKADTLSETEFRRVSTRVSRLHNATGDNDLCAVCLEEMKPGNDLTMLACDGRHVFHSACVSEWLLTASRCCPVDKQDLKIARAEPISIE